MNIISNLIQGANYAFSFLNIIGILLGYFIGVIVGATPGLTSAMAIVLLLPFTYTLSPLFAIATLMGCYKGGVYGGSITAITFNIPGTPMAAATSIDGYPMKIKGEGLRALEMALFASMIGGTFSNLLLLFTAPPLAHIALKLGSAEIAGLIFFSLTVVTGLMGDTPLDIWKGLVSLGGGLLFAMIGLDIMTATRRYVFGLLPLDSGIDFVPAIIGLLALSEVFIQVEKIADLNILTMGGELSLVKKPTWKSRIIDLKICAKDIFRSSLIGSFIGALPGLGATTAAFMGYGEAKRASKHPETFGKGEIIGIAAPEAANNAVCASSMIPLVTLGIPGSVVAAALFGAFMIQGMMPGPMLMKTDPQVLYGLFFLMILTDILGGIFVAYPLIFLSTHLQNKINYSILFPVIVVFCCVGTYGVKFSTFDINIVLFLGILGYIMKKEGFSPAIFLLAFILGPILEINFRTALVISRGSISIFMRPVALMFIILGVFSLIFSMKRKLRKPNYSNSVE
jgi:putative tricarboxylic transport membrane protein